MRRWLWPVIAGAALAACGGGDRYPPEYRHTFVAACVDSGGLREMCECAWDRVESEVPRADYEAYERVVSAGGAHPFTETLLGYGQQCMAELRQQN